MEDSRNPSFSAQYAIKQVMVWIKEAATIGDLDKIERLTAVANALKISSAAETHSDGIDDANLRSNTGAVSAHRENPGSNPPRNKKLVGKEMRQGWLQKLHSGDIVLTKIKGRTYGTVNGTTVGIACATESPLRPRKWWMGLLDENYDIVVLLCKDEQNVVHDFVLPAAFLRFIWGTFSRSGGQVEFHVEHSGGNYHLRAPGGHAKEISKFEANFEAFRGTR